MSNNSKFTPEYLQDLYDLARSINWFDEDKLDAAVIEEQEAFLDDSDEDDTDG